MDVILLLFYPSFYCYEFEFCLTSDSVGKHWRSNVNGKLVVSVTLHVVISAETAVDL